MSGDPKLVQAVLDEEWYADEIGCVYMPDTVAVLSSVGKTPDDVDTERARQAALGHRALQLLASMAITRGDPDERWPDAVHVSRAHREQAYKIVAELRSGK